MKRRDFLKLLAVAPLAPSVLAAKKAEAIIIDDDTPLVFGEPADYHITWDTGGADRNSVLVGSDNYLLHVAITDNLLGDLLAICIIP